MEAVTINGAPAEAELILTASGGLLTWNEKDSKKTLILEKELLGIARQAQILTIHAIISPNKESKVRRGRGGGDERRPVRKEIVLEAADEAAAEAWRERIQACLDSLGRPKKLFILVNPFGGKKEASKIFENEVKPLLDAAGIYCSVQETRYQLHAQELAGKLDLTSYDGIVCVSGDGILAEVVNGLLQRDDWQEAIKMPLGIIPGGTGNGMAKSLLDAVGESFSASNAAISVICGNTRKVDVSTVTQGDRKFFSILMLAWGLIADLDIESEKYRWMGSKRIDFYALLRVLRLRKYHGRVHFVPAPGYESHGEPATGVQIFEDEVTNGDIKKGYQGPVISFNSSEWRTLDGPFIFIWIHNVPWGSADSMPAPDAEFSDGCLDVVMVRECPKPTLLSLLGSVCDGSHVKYPCAIYLKVKAFRLEPGQRVNEPEKGGIVDVDGEVLARGSGTYLSGKRKDLMAYGPPINMHIDQGLATLFAPIPPSECNPTL